MPERRPLIPALLELDAELQRAPLSAEAEARLRETIDRARGSRGARRWWWGAASLAAACACALLAWLWLRPSGPARPGALGGFALIDGKARMEGDGVVRCRSARCDLAAVELGVELELRDASAVRRRSGAEIQLLGGTARCRVAHRAPGEPPLRLRVSAGVIEVLGTRFLLEQHAEGGRVELEEGSIRFRADDGRVVQLRPGQRLSWPLPPPPSRPASIPARGRAEARPASPAHPARRGEARDAGPPLSVEQAESLLEEIERLRSQGRFAEVARRLRQSLPRIADPAMRERMSFELGTVLGQQLRDARAACAHWRRHLQRFGPRRYGVEIRAARRELGCEEQPAP